MSKYRRTFLFALPYRLDSAKSVLFVQRRPSVYKQCRGISSFQFSTSRTTVSEEAQILRHQQKTRELSRHLPALLMMHELQVCNNVPSLPQSL